MDTRHKNVFCSPVEKVDGTNFNTKDKYGRTLIQVASMRNNTAVLNYLRTMKKRSLEGVAAYNVAKYMANRSDVESLEIPEALKPLVLDFLEEGHK